MIYRKKSRIIFIVLVARVHLIFALIFVLENSEQVEVEKQGLLQRL